MDKQAFELLKDRLDRIDDKLDKLHISHLGFKNKVYGVVSTISLIVSTGAWIFVHFLKKNFL